MTLLTAELLTELERLQIHSPMRLGGRFAGEHRSFRYGNAVDFADYRQYQPGDDFRRIDYHVLARLDQVLLKLYEADDEVTLRLLIDTSASMAIGGKLDLMQRIAAGLGFVSLTTHDTVTVHTFPSTGNPPRFSGRAAVSALFSFLETLRAGGGTPFALAAADLLSRPGPPGLTVVISDLLTSEWDALVGLGSRGSDVVLVHLLARQDTDPELSGDLELIDTEDATRMPVSLTPDVAAAFRQRVEAWMDNIRSRCTSVGVFYLPVGADADLEELLLRSWRRSGLLG